MMCIFAKNEQVMENMKRHPEQMKKWVDAEIKLGFTWKQKTSLQELWEQCFDIDDVTVGENEDGILQQNAEQKTQ